MHGEPCLGDTGELSLRAYGGSAHVCGGYTHNAHRHNVASNIRRNDNIVGTVCYLKYGITKTFVGLQAEIGLNRYGY